VLEGLRKTTKTFVRIFVALANIPTTYLQNKLSTEPFLLRVAGPVPTVRYYYKKKLIAGGHIDLFVSMFNLRKYYKHSD
jgi:hypothetical protein